jgi:3-oxoacyl-[acyl-carrier-protein] synthase III
MPQSQPAIAGLGLTAQGKVYGKTAAQFAAEAVRLAVADAGLSLGDLDGLLVSTGLSSSVSIDLQGALGLTDLRLLTFMQGYGSTAAQMVQYAAMAVQSGTADKIAVVWADDPLKEKTRTSAAYTAARSAPGAGAGSPRPTASTRPTPCTRSRRGAT